MTGTCACGAVRVTIAARPAFIHDCDCSLCRKTGGAWGYFSADEVSVSGASSRFIRPDKPGAAAEIHFCAACGSTTHFGLSESFRNANPGADQAGVNMRLFDRAELEGVEVRFPNGADWPGTGPFGYRRAAITISAGERW